MAHGAVPKRHPRGEGIRKVAIPAQAAIKNAARRGRDHAAQRREQRNQAGAGPGQKAAQRYRELTGKPLGITGEVAEYEAARLLNLELTDARQAGYDAIRNRNGKREQLQIKGRCVPPGASKSQQLGSIDISKPFDAVLLVLMDEQFNATSIYEARRKPVIAALTARGSRAHARGALAVSKFRAIGKQVWPKTG